MIKINLEKLVSYFKTNYRSLTASFLLALFLWIAVTSDKEYTYIIQVPLKIETLGPNLVLKKQLPESVRLKVIGTGRSLFALNFVDKQIGLEFPEINSDQIINLTDYINKFQFPQDLGVTVVDVISPKKLNIDVDKFYQTRLPVKVISNIKPVPGYLLVNYSASPDSVFVSGPKSLILDMTDVPTDTVNKSDVRFPFEYRVKFKFPNEEVIHFEPLSTQIEFKIEPIVERTLYNIPIIITDVPNDISAEATPASISIRVKGGESRISSLSQDDLHATFDFRDHFISGRMQYPMEIKTPDDVTWIEVSPKTFNLKLIRKD